MTPAPPLSNVRVVLLEPQDPVNIAAVVRAMKNMGLAQLHLVRPVEYDITRIELVAHDTRDIAERIRHFDLLDEALADCVEVVAFTARRRAARRNVTTPRDMAPALLRSAALGPVALLFGREDSGLPNDALDRAQLVATIPTTEHKSLNLAQAVLIALYELHLAAPEASRILAPPRKAARASTTAEYERYFGNVERALQEMDFFRTRNPELILRTIRSLSFRAAPDARELQLLRAMALEVVKAIRRARSHP
ncbi:MAG TPA: TrmJ/YjtD family RNA methyltransferase [Gemmatimonadaceae bacterium]|nr:TrmJ/YjtD family RNA methyltransferase [Gemmatimonadaceae bacterium]